MKTILFATDFSRASRLAALMAAQVALKTNAKLILFHAYRYIAPYDPEINALVVTKYELENSTISALKRLKKRLIDKVSTELDTEILAGEGFTEEAIVEAIREKKADLLIMGTTGHSPIATRFFGSVATSMLKKSPVPVLLNPVKARFKTFENAVLALDLSKEVSSVAISKLLLFFKHFPSVLNIVTVTRSENEEEIEKLKEKGTYIRELLKDQPHTFTVISGEKPTTAILKFAKKSNADLIVSLPKHHNFFERLLTESNTERLALDADVPVLAIP